METALAVLVGCFFAAGIYLILSRHIIRLLLGIALFGNAVNLLIFTAGRVSSETPPIIPPGQDTISVATANRFARALGFDGYPQFRAALVMGYRFSINRNGLGFEQNFDDVVRNAAVNVRQAVGSVTENR